MARHQFAVLSLAAIALVSSFWFLLDVLGTATHSTKAFGVAAFENRFNDFRKAFQPYGVYGYVSDNPPNDPSALAEFHLTQYTLAPAIIKQVRQPEPRDCELSQQDNWTPRLLRANHLALFQDFGNGVALCRRAQR